MSESSPQPIDALLLQAQGAVRGGAWGEGLRLYGMILQAGASGMALRGKGLCLYKLGRLPEAVEALRHALALDERDLAAWDLLGIVLLKSGEPAEAARCFRRAIAVKGDAPLYSNLAAALLDAGAYGEAVAAAEEAVRLVPGDLTARHNLAKGYIKSGRAREAVELLETLVTQRAADGELWLTLGTALEACGRAVEAEQAIRQSIALRPTPRAHSQLLFVMHEAGRHGAEILEESRRWDEIYKNANMNEVGIDGGVVFGNSREAGRRLRVGYVSGDFKGHPLATFLLPLLRAHHQDPLEVFCYSHVLVPDGMTELFKGAAGHWRDISRVSDAAAVEMIRADGIDVLVDLAGHCAGNRLGIFARRAAPVQMTYLGYPGTTGLAAMGYRLTDGRLDVPGMTERFCSERLLRLEGTFAAYGAPEGVGEVGALPLEGTGFCRFGSFNARAKVNDGVMHAWGDILRRVAGSRLDLVGFEGSEAGRIGRLMAEHGVAAERVGLVGRVGFAEYFAAHREIDIHLDTFPLSGHTVVCHAAWMGVPSVCRRGGIYWERLGGSVMECLGLEDFVAGSVEEYVEVAVRKAGDLAGLSAVRAGLRERMRGSVLMDYEGHARRVEEAMREAWGMTKFE